MSSSMSPDLLREYVAVMREQNVLVFESDGMKIALGPAPAPPLPARDPDAPAPAPKKSQYESLLFAATEGIPEDE